MSYDVAVAASIDQGWDGAWSLVVMESVASISKYCNETRKIRGSQVQDLQLPEDSRPGRMGSRLRGHRRA